MSHARYLVGDVFDRMAELPDGSVDLILTSPPFLALRSYLPADHPDKDREIGSEPTPAVFLDTLLALTAEWRRLLAPHGSICVELGDTYSGANGWGDDAGNERYPAGRSGGTRSQPTGPGWPLAKSLCGIPHLYHLSLAYGRNLLTGVESPAGSWRVRNVVAWCRPNPPVGALGDKFRPGTSYMTVACVSGSRYFDLDAVRTPSQYADRDYAYSDTAKQGPNRTDSAEATNGIRRNTGSHPAGAPPLDWWEIPEEERTEVQQLAAENAQLWELLHHHGIVGHPDQFTPSTRFMTVATQARDRYFDLDAVRQPFKEGSRWAEGKLGKNDSYHSAVEGGYSGDRVEKPHEAGAPPLDWWEIPTQPYKGAHYATWPTELCRKPIESMCPRRVCTVCDQPSRRITEAAEWPASTYKTGRSPMGHERGGADNSEKINDGGRIRDRNVRAVERTTLGWSDCGHDAWRNGLVLDPFAGSGTTLAVATGHGRDAVGIDLDPRNAELAYERIGGLFLEIDDGAPRGVA